MWESFSPSSSGSEATSVNSVKNRGILCAPDSCPTRPHTEDVGSWLLSQDIKYVLIAGEIHQTVWGKLMFLVSVSAPQSNPTWEVSTT